MKKTLLVLSAIVLFAAFQPAKAQIRFGVQAGVNLSSIGSSDDKMNTKLGFHAGLTTEIPIVMGLQFNPGILYSMKGATDEVKIAGITGKNNITTHHITVPLFFSYKLSLGNIAIAPQVGPYIGYGLGGNAKTTANDKELSNVDVYGEETPSLNANAFEFGLGLGLNVHFGNIAVGAGYDLPFSNFTDAVTVGNVTVAEATKMSNIRISVAYLF